MVTPQFSFLGGALCLDFVNTVGGYEGVKILRDKLAGPNDLRRWAALAGLSDEVAPDEFRRAIMLRNALYRILRSVVLKKAPPARDLEILNNELGRARQKLRYRSGTFQAKTPGIVGAIVRSAMDLLTSTDLSRLRMCAGDACAWMFLDTSRNGSRHWCDMRVCGNRAKARNFRQKRL